MPRGLTAAQKSALAKRTCNPAWFVELVLVAQTVRIWNGLGTAVIGGNSWLGVGELGIIDGMATDFEGGQTGISISLVGLPLAPLANGAIAATRAVRYQARPLNVYFGTCDIETGIPFGSLVNIWAGQADALSFKVGTTVTVTLTGEDLSSRLRRTNGLRMTADSHNRYVGNGSTTDLFFDAQTRLMGQAKATLKQG